MWEAAFASFAKTEEKKMPTPTGPGEEEASPSSRATSNKQCHKEMDNKQEEKERVVAEQVVSIAMEREKKQKQREARDAQQKNAMTISISSIPGMETAMDKHKGRKREDSNVPVNKRPDIKG